MSCPHVGSRQSKWIVTGVFRVRVQDCLSAFTESEALDAAAGFRCDSCNKQVGDCASRCCRCFLLCS